jgi:hypothetical protein
MNTETCLKQALENLNDDTFSIKDLANLAKVSEPTARKFAASQPLEIVSRGLFRKKTSEVFKTSDVFDCDTNTSEDILNNSNEKDPEEDKDPSKPYPAVENNNNTIDLEMCIASYMKGFDLGFKMGLEKALSMKDK